MGTLRRGLLVTTILVPCAALGPAGGAAAQGGTIALDTIDVVPVTPVGGAAGTGRSATGERIASGGTLPLAKVPFTVEDRHRPPVRAGSRHPRSDLPSPARLRG